MHFLGFGDLGVVPLDPGQNSVQNAAINTSVALTATPFRLDVGTKCYKYTASGIYKDILLDIIHYMYYITHNALSNPYYYACLCIHGPHGPHGPSPVPSPPLGAKIVSYGVELLLWCVLLLPSYDALE